MYLIRCIVVGQPKATKIPLVFYRTTAGIEPVRKWLKGLAPDERKAVGTDLMRAQWRWPIGMPLCRPMGHGLWEVRTDLPRNRIARVMFFEHAGELMALHGFIKKTQKTSTDDLALAKNRIKEVQR